MASKSFTLVKDCSTLTMFFLSRVKDSKLCRRSLGVEECYMVMDWVADSSHHLTDT